MMMKTTFLVHKEIFIPSFLIPNFFCWLFVSWEEGLFGFIFFFINGEEPSKTTAFQKLLQETGTEVLYTPNRPIPLQDLPCLLSSYKTEHISLPLVQTDLQPNKKISVVLSLFGVL